MNIQYHGKSEKGLRDNNEDAFFAGRVGERSTERKETPASHAASCTVFFPVSLPHIRTR
ncbi:MAG: hypothetical protein WC586_03480 [Methanoregula sp.]